MLDFIQQAEIESLRSQISQLESTVEQQKKDIDSLEDDSLRYENGFAVLIELINSMGVHCSQEHLDELTELFYGKKETK